MVATLLVGRDQTPGFQPNPSGLRGELVCRAGRQQKRFGDTHKLLVYRRRVFSRGGGRDGTGRDRHIGSGFTDASCIYMEYACTTVNNGHPLTATSLVLEVVVWE